MTQNLYNQLQEFILELKSKKKKLTFYLEVTKESQGAGLYIHSKTGWHEKEINDDPLGKKLDHYFESEFKLPWISQNYHTAYGTFILNPQGKIYLDLFVIENHKAFYHQPEESIQKINFSELGTYVIPNQHKFTLMMQCILSPELHFKVNVWTEPLQGDTPPPVPKNVKEACKQSMWKIIQPYAKQLTKGSIPIINFNIIVEVQPNGYGKFTVDHTTAPIIFFPKVFLELLEEP